MQVDIITRHSNLSSHQVRVRAELGGHSGRAVWRYAASRAGSAEICRSAYYWLGT